MIAARKTMLAKPSRRLLAAFHLYLHWYIGRHFHALRVAHPDRFSQSADAPLIIYLNHASWWDPLTCAMLARHFMPKADHYGPMEEAALRRYGFFRKLGVFPVEMNTARGAMQFIRTSNEILSRSNSALWLTPEGRFTDPRRRPLDLKNGLASLLSQHPQLTIQPLAIEYIYWDERLPEILVNCGDPIHINDGGKYSFAERNRILTAALGSVQDELATLAIARDASQFDKLVTGRAGIGAIYDSWQHVRSAARGEPYKAEHGSIPHS